MAADFVGFSGWLYCRLGGSYDRIKVQGAGRVLAMGPYLAVGVMLAALWGNSWLAGIWAYWDFDTVFSVAKIHFRWMKCIFAHLKIYYCFRQDCRDAQ